MAWGLTDDKLHSHRKTLKIPRARRCEAMGLWTLVNSWCNDHGTDGTVPRDIWDEFATSPEIAQLLVTAGFWEEAPDGFQVINWAKYNKTAAELLEKREAERQRKANWRQSKAEKNASLEGSPSTVPTGHVGQSGSVTSSSALTHTHTHTHTQDKETPSRSATVSELPVRFEDFYSVYPRKVGRPSAIKAFTAAVKIVDVETIIDAARRYAVSPQLPRDKKYIPHPSTWLHDQRWDDVDEPAMLQFRDEKSGLLVER